MILRRLRRDSPPSLTYSPRSNVSQSKHLSIDAALKDLRNISRRLHKTSVILRDELRILERLYYKGKNQHRSALFWRRVVEVRRYGNRVNEMSIHNVVESLRCSFFGHHAQSNPKLLKGAWTSTPGIDYLSFADKRLFACSDLLTKMHSRLIEAQKCFSLVMQTSAFLQLVLTLTAITSRLDIISQEICHLTKDAQSVCQRLLDTLKSQQLTPDAESIDGRIIIPNEVDEREHATEQSHPQPSIFRSSPLDESNASTAPIAPVIKKVPAGIVEPKRKKKKKDAIDEIFGF